MGLEEAKFFRFANGELTLISEPGVEVDLTVADSWLVEDGKVRHLKAHFDRFANWVGDCDQTAVNQLDSFFDAVKQKIPSEGSWFPRMEFHAEAPEKSRLHFRLRPAPAVSPTAVLWVSDEPDNRRNAAVKGPDLSLGMQLRRKAQLHGADEAIFLTASGYVNEGALSALIWWRSDTLMATPETELWLPSITRSEVFQLALDCGYETATELASVASLENTEVWLLSSLQGIRPVSEIIDGQKSYRMAPPLKAEHFQKRLRLLASSIF